MPCTLRDQITSPARTVLLVLLAASALVFVIACSNVANLILARSVRREGELAVRAALGAGAGALRRTLLAESLVLCGAGAVLGVLIARPMVAVLARYASRFSVRALDLTVDASLLWVGVGLALAAAVLLAFVPRLPSADAANGFGLSNGSVRITSGTNRRLRVFAVTQIAASFVLLAGAGMLLTTLLALQRRRPASTCATCWRCTCRSCRYGRTPRADRSAFYQEVMRRIAELPGVERVAVGTLVPWRDAGAFGPGFQFTVEGYAQGRRRRGSARAIPHRVARLLRRARRADHRRPRLQRRRPRATARRSSSSARAWRSGCFRTQDAVNRRLMWTDPVMKFIDVSTGAAAHRRHRRGRGRRERRARPGDDASITRSSRRSAAAGCSCTRATDPYALVPPITRIIRELSAEQPVEQAATLEDVRAEVLAPDRLNALVFGGFAAVALTIAIVGVAGVLAFSVSARTREFGIRLAIGSAPRQLLTGVLAEGAVIAAGGIVAGAVGGFALARARRRVHRGGAHARARCRSPARGDDSGRRRGARVAGAGRARVARRRHAGAAV